ncbi:7-cyano-7-deazaguanine synthase [Priestia aryabhattai]|uniref:7-cyano-7-deazaguanine synthase n=1 Tax=Priestia aryabhattai TaxID=412384 RepID=UPI001CC9E380|nr:7-cyano-7-deazaguanine synthase [Priestia aryabhattai]MBZ6489539.1 7-cyano-7-deazaguanine synthase [Priestia aryabhattai]
MHTNKVDERFLILGEVYTDVHLDISSSPLRIGGIFHSARAFNAINCNYALAAIAPKYLMDSIRDFGKYLNAQYTAVVGEINGAPNVITIKDSSENGDNGYNDILRGQSRVTIDQEELNSIIQDYNPTDIIIYPGKYDIKDTFSALKSFKGKIHIDVQYGTKSLEEIVSSGLNLSTIILSTSSTLFKENDFSVIKLVNSPLITNARVCLLKENRGGSTLYNIINKEWYEAPAFKTDTVHSVGVGDCFNAVFLSESYKKPAESALKIASYISMLYASTFVFEEFKELVSHLNFNDVDTLLGNRISWAEREKHHIYIAGPDFPDVDTRLIEELYNSLKYHNFVPHRPVIENGLITGRESHEQQEQAYRKDIALLEKSSILIAVILNDDPGTYVEIGWMAKNGKPVVIFDPYKRVRNLFLKKSANYITSSLSEVIDLVYEILGKNNNKSNETYDSLLLASGGLDSTVLAYKLLSEGKKVLPLFLKYGQHFSNTELNTLIDVLPPKLIPHVKVINIEDIYKYSESRMIKEPNLWLDNVKADDLYLPYRNLLFLSIASSIAQTLGIRDVYSAFINSNHAKEIDCSKQFFDTLSDMLSEYGAVQICMPFRDFSKADVINLGISLDVPIVKTYSCQANSKTPCGVCPNCVDRLNGFKVISELNSINN